MKRVLKGIWYTTLIFIVLGLIVSVVGYTLYIRPIVNHAKSVAYDKLSSIDTDTFRRLSDTEIYGKDGSLIGKVNVGDYEYRPISEISKYITDGYIAVEDRNFANHNGIDLKAIARAGIALIKHDGVVTQGGSTITQQVLKNNVIGIDTNKWERKILEIFLAPEFEKEFSKAEIMEFYCNTNFYQNGCYGVESAAQYYFGKSAKDVSIGEAAGLVGLSNNPAKYNPVKHPEAYLDKRNRVLTDMLEQGKITQDEFNKADNEELNLVLKREKGVKESYPVSYAIHCATLELMQSNGFNMEYSFDSQEGYDTYREEYTEVYSDTANTIRSGGYRIYTTLDSIKQKKLQELVDRNMANYTERNADGRYALQSAVTLINNKTGYVEAVIGGRGTDDEYNRAFLGYRQPGSVIKPLVVYAPAFETGRYYPSLKIKDEPIENGPKNSGGSYRGLMSIREAIGRSTNTIAYRILQDIKPSTGVSYLSKLGFNRITYLDQYNGSMALGGFTYGATTTEIAKGYSTLVNKGEYVDSTCITKIEYQDGNIPYTGKVNKKQVYTSDASYMTIDSLRGVLDEGYGTGKVARVAGQIIAGKTGTTNSNKDRWFCGATTSYTTAVWVGYDEPKAMHIKENLPAKIFRDIMAYLHDGWESQEFVRPSTVYEASVDYKGEQVDYETGETDIFSMVATERLSEARKEAEEKARVEAERKAMEVEKRLMEEIDIKIKAFSNIEILEKGDIAKLDRDYDDIKGDISNISSYDTREQISASLNSYYEAFNNLEIVKNFRIEIETDRRKAEEEARQREIEQARREAETKDARLGAARKALDNLKLWTEDNYSVLLKVADEAIKDCKEYGEYYDMRAEFREIESEIHVYFNPPVVVDVPDIADIPDANNDNSFNGDIAEDEIILDAEGFEYQ